MTEPYRLTVFRFYLRYFQYVLYGVSLVGSALLGARHPSQSSDLEHYPALCLLIFTNSLPINPTYL
ncbi:hypothetical protein IC229_25045 [Spirosoma sp. BT702]|uniref:Uncharacterized protein n=1 Tax=Spirosoma profusum TaxID=2771354 RepID=A0A926Y113_9BACT|nr:hypothetical protein [Spirosoma profusum]